MPTKAKSYPGDFIVNPSSPYPDTTENTLKSVPNAFSLIYHRTNYNSFVEEGAFPSDEYTAAHNHFQGIQRLKDGHHFVISGGSGRDKIADLIVCKADNYGHHPNSKDYYAFPRIESAIGSNVIHEKKPLPNDKIIGVYQINRTLKGNKYLKHYWHAGGMDVCGDILVVSLENSKVQKSLIRFYDFSNPEKPKLINTQKSIKGNSGAVALTKITGGKFLLASWTDSDDGPDRFDFYISKKANDLSSWEDEVPFHYQNLVPEYDQEPKFQAINFVQQEDGKLFLVGTGNTNKIAPYFGGKKYASLFEVIYFENEKNEPKFHLLKVNQRKFEGGGFFANFGAGAGVYVNSQNKMAIYSAHHWRRNGILNIGEFWPVLEPNAAKIIYKRDLVIELYEHTHFRGKVLRVYDEKYASSSNLEKFFVEGVDFGDKISSIRMILPEGYKFCLFPDDTHNGISTPFIGTGYYSEEADLDNFGIKYSSCKIEPVIELA